MHSLFPDTRRSLILRLPDREDAEAWDQFLTIYEPLVYRLARAKDLQDADAREVVQEVLVAVAGAVERWEPDPQRGRFRDWLFCIARNLVIQFLTRKKHRPLGTGDSRVVELLHQEPDPASEATAQFDLEYRREVFRWAADRVREQVTPSTWRAFWMTSVEEQTTAAAAEATGLSVGAVHIARSRVRGRLREAVRQWRAAEAHPEGIKP